MMELCDRRGFVTSLAALGVAGAARPARGDEAPPLKISPIREGGVGEVLKVAHFEIAAGAVKPFRILHASDTHLNFWNVTDFYGNEARERNFGTRWVRFPQALTSLLATIGYARERGCPSSTRATSSTGTRAGTRRSAGGRWTAWTSSTRSATTSTTRRAERRLRFRRRRPANASRPSSPTT